MNSPDPSSARSSQNLPEGATGSKMAKFSLMDGAKHHWKLNGPYRPGNTKVKDAPLNQQCPGAAATVKWTIIIQYRSPSGEAESIKNCGTIWISPCSAIAGEREQEYQTSMAAKNAQLAARSAQLLWCAMAAMMLNYWAWNPRICKSN
jgi:hypothetical protein